MPKQAKTVNDALFEIASFNLIDTETYVDPYVLEDLPETEPFSEAFEEAGYESSNIITNVSASHWVILANLTFLIVYGLILRPICLKRNSCVPRDKKIKNYFFCNGLIKMFMAYYLDLLMCAIINLYLWRQASNGYMWYSIGFAIFSLAVCVSLSIYALALCR